MRLQESLLPIRHLSLALLTGGLLTLSFPGWEIWVLAWVALAPLMLAAGRERGPFRAFGLGVVSGTFFYYTSCWWLTYSPVHYADFPLLVAYALLLVPTVAIGLFVGVFALLVNITVRRWGPTGMLAAPVFWVACEWLRGTTTGVEWNYIGYSQAFRPALIQCAAIGGVHAVGFLLAVSSAALTFTALAPSRRAARRVLTATLALIILNIGYGAYVLTTTEAVEDGLPVVALQPNLSIDILRQSRQEAFDTTFSRLGQMGEQELARANAPAIPSPALIVWPEMPFVTHYDQEFAVRIELAKRATQRGDYILMNSLGTPEREGGSTNSAVLIGPNGLKVGQYDKVRLLPFGEYIPLRNVFPFNQLSSFVQDFTPGQHVQILDADGAQIGVQVCYESSFAWIARAERNAGVSGYVNISNDAWFGPTPMSRQHLAHAVMRSVENRTEQVRVTNAGHSARIDAAGRLVDSTELFVQISRRWQLPRHPVASPPLYTRLGDWLPIGCATGTLALVVAYFARRKKDPIEDTE